jgi:DNA-binding GntR family transcriptional regulator
MTSSFTDDNNNERTTNAADRTRADAAYRRLREDILACRLRPRERLRLEQLRARYGLGITPIREGLLRLAAEGLVILIGQRGGRVAPLSEADLLDVERLSKIVEDMALRLSIRHGDMAWESRVVAAFHHLSRHETGPSGSLAGDAAYETLHDAFHRALVSACGSPRLLAFRDLLYAHSERYRHFAYGAGFVEAERDVLAEHRAIYEAALARDADRAGRALVAHIDRTMRIALNRLRRMTAAAAA